MLTRGRFPGTQDGRGRWRIKVGKETGGFRKGRDSAARPFFADEEESGKKKPGKRETREGGERESEKVDFVRGPEDPPDDSFFPASSAMPGGKGSWCLQGGSKLAPPPALVERWDTSTLFGASPGSQNGGQENPKLSRFRVESGWLKTRGQNHSLAPRGRAD